MILQDLFAMQDLTYRDFMAKLIPTVDKETVIGVRIPLLRQYAKHIRSNEEVQNFMTNLPHRYFEENQLHILLLEGLTDEVKLYQKLNEFLPYVDNWSTCDLCSPKLFDKNPPSFDTVKAWVKDDKEYTIRFGINMLMRYYLTERFCEEVFALVLSVKEREEYYLKMAVAWFFATALSVRFEDTLWVLEQKCLPKWTHQKTIQKGMESRIVTAEQKEILRHLKLS